MTDKLFSGAYLMLAVVMATISALAFWKGMLGWALWDALMCCTCIFFYWECASEAY